MDEYKKFNLIIAFFTALVKFQKFLGGVCVGFLVFKLRNFKFALPKQIMSSFSKCGDIFF